MLHLAGGGGGGGDAILSLSTKQLRMRRNPEHKDRIPGGAVIANSASEVVAASIRLTGPDGPSKRIPTYVSRKAGRARASAAAPLSSAAAAAVSLAVTSASQQLYEVGPASASSGNGVLVADREAVAAGNLAAR